MSAIITVQEVHKSFGPRHILAGVSFAIHQGDRIGIVGLNGAGKSTLLRLIVGPDSLPLSPSVTDGARDETPDSGLITRRRGLTLSYVPQEPPLDPRSTVRDALRSGLSAHTAAMARLDTLAEAVTRLEGRALEQALLEQATLHEHLSRTRAWDAEHELRGLSAALSLPPMETEIGVLSGGERRRVALGQALLSAPEVLALDEPTNHLDLRTVEWLEERLLAHEGTLLLITHDRYFLDRVATRILELDRGQIYSYDGGYSRFLEKQAERLASEANRERERVSFIRRELDWIRRGPQARGTKQKARIDRFNDAVAARPDGLSGLAPGGEAAMQLRLGGGDLPRLGKTILELREVSKSLGGKRLFQRLTLVLKPGDRIGVVGPNGVGKSTLVRTILSQVPPDEGQVIVGQNTRFAYLDQGRADLDDERSVLEEVAGDGDHVHLLDGKVHVRTFLRRMLFDDRFADAKVGTLSGGERNRVQLAKLLRQGGNFLILDEPTNDLDLLTLGVLEEALATFPGCALVVSHDRWFLDRVATAILAFLPDGQVELHEGSYSAYRERTAAQLEQVTKDKAASKAPRPAPASEARAQPEQRRLSYQERRELDGMEAAITAAEAEVARLEATLAEPGIYKDRGAEVPGLLAALDQARAAVEALYSRWQALEQIAQIAQIAQRAAPR